MSAQLDEVEARVLGCLVEKALTTPELYPLTLNSLVNACNQKTSREPVMSLQHSVVERALASLLEKGLAGRIYEPGGRAAKFSHRIETLVGSEDAKVIGTVCVLLLRGAQTAGEIKARTERLCRFEGAAEVDALLAELASRPGGPIVARLPRQPGQKEARYRQLFSSTASGEEAPPAAEPEPDRLDLLEKRIEALEASVEELRAGRTHGS